ncbi:tyrosine-type recombinase/integrase [Pseudomonas synxantha]|jgi:integrase|uniref:Tyrosine-type recombinase/integrase n=1 Tax=Pseudomonas synxantha TaxID=47883 RepID=A0ABS0UIF4_9PSED|nr:tyrosine-type recombinase/integrase [Pseudomonas synxantha]MBI6565378.1 tyrosine-type recombinase/integrase [Pseudomonas synxantha]MBI6581721.1 tyrosine-type recombinase/integrase [Pseudomonas synxantha]MBI6646275.1 tyrosine-type recombinase/integrase [Pseudomonas synxantha]
MGFSDLLITAFETFVINEPASAGFFIKGHLASTTLHPYSFSRVLRRALTRSGVAGERHSGHSLRHGFATWASRNQWSPKALMGYVGWRDVHSAMRYVEADSPFGDWRRECGAESKWLR